MKKTDRFEQMAKRYHQRNGLLFDHGELAKLLRREHQAVVRMVIKNLADYLFDGKYYVKRSDLLRLLAKRAK